MDQEKRFKKWQWIEVSATKATNDSRPESFKINSDSIVVGELIGTKHGWCERRELIEPLRRHSMCRIQKERDDKGAPTLGVVRPFQIKRLSIEDADQTEWTQEQRTALTRDDLFSSR